MKTPKRLHFNFFLILAFFLPNQVLLAQCQNSFACPFDPVGLAHDGSVYTISSFCGTNTYTQLTNVRALEDYEFTITRDGVHKYITVRVGAIDGPVLAHGSSPLQVSTTSNSNLFVHWTEDAACTTSSSSHKTTFQCTSCSPPPPPPAGSITDIIPFQAQPQPPVWEENGYELYNYGFIDWFVSFETGSPDTVIFLGGPLGLNLSQEAADIQRVELVITDYCGLGCTYAQAFFKNGTSDFRYNQLIGDEEIFAFDAAGNGGIDSVKVFSYEGYASEFRVIYLPLAGCPVSLTLDQNPIESGVYEAEETIVASGTVDSGSVVTMRAGLEVALEPPFNSKAGSKLTVEIGPCSNLSPPSGATTSSAEYTGESTAPQRPQMVSPVNLAISPNPAREEISVEYRIPGPGRVLLDLFNTTGEALKSQHFTRDHSTGGTYRQPIAISGLPSGVYILVLQSPYGHANRKLIVHR